MAVNNPLSQLWRRTSIKGKILIICGTLIVLRLVMNGVYFTSYQKLEQYERLGHSIHNLTIDLYRLNTATEEAFYTNGAMPQISNIRHDLPRSKNSLTALLKVHGKLEPFSEEIQTLQPLTDRYYATLTGFLKQPSIFNLNETHSLQQLGILSSQSNQLFSRLDRLNETVSDHINTQRENVFTFMLSMGTVIFTVSIALLLLLYRGVIGPLKLLGEMRRLLTLAKDKGDFGHQLQGEGVNEVGLLARDFNALMRSLKTNIGQASQTVSLVANHVERLSKEVAISHDDLQQQQSEIVHLNSIAHQMGQLYDTIQKHGQLISGYIHELDGALRDTLDVSRKEGAGDKPVRQLQQRLEQLTGINSALNELAQQMTAELQMELTSNQLLQKDIAKITRIENHALETSDTITNASEELYALSRLLTCEVCKLQPDNDRLCKHQLEKERCRELSCTELLLQLEQAHP